MFFKKKKYSTVSHDIYQKIVKFSRNKMFYTNLGYLKSRKKYLKFLKSQEILSEPFRDKLGQFKKFYFPDATVSVTHSPISIRSKTTRPFC